VELLFVALGGALVGLAARYFLPGRGVHGSVLVPAIGTAVASVVWVLLTWLRWKWDGGWIWWVSLGLAAIVSVAVDIVLSRTRTESDRRMLHTFMKTGVPGHS
jgi:ABC-type branched-subunit amino acid transport system permease subunit